MFRKLGRQVVINRRNGLTPGKKNIILNMRRSEFGGFSKKSTFVDRGLERKRTHIDSPSLSRFDRKRTHIGTPGLTGLGRFERKKTHIDATDSIRTKNSRKTVYKAMVRFKTSGSLIDEHNGVGSGRHRKGSNHKSIKRRRNTKMVL